MNEQIEMKEMFRNGGHYAEIWWKSKSRWNKWLDMVEMTRNPINKQIEMKQMIRNDGNDREIWWITKLRWNKWLEMVEMTWTFDEKANWDERND
jgi:hypothetical protein